MGKAIRPNSTLATLVLLLAVSQVALCQCAAGRCTPLRKAPEVARQAGNPYEGQAVAAQAGARLFRRHCASCHGSDAKGGVGKAPPLLSAEVKAAQPGALFWVLRNGSLGSGMPSFSWLPDERRWQIITWLRRMNE